LSTDRLAELRAHYALTPEATNQLDRLLAHLAVAPWAPTTVTATGAAIDAHVADSLTGLEVPALRDARRIVDLGSGAGFPALVLAVALPDCRVTAVESARRKCDFIAEVAGFVGVSNLDVVCARAEDWRDGLAANDVVCARAVSSLGVLMEYAAPLLREGGTLVAWKGRIERDEITAAHAAAEILGFAPPGFEAVQPFPSAEHRQLVTVVKAAPTPERFPRRTGVALKRPLGV